MESKSKINNNNKNRNKLIDSENRLVVAKWKKGLGELGETGGATKKYNWQLQSRDVNYNRGNVVNNMVRTAWCQAGAGRAGGNHFLIYINV